VRQFAVSVSRFMHAVRRALRKEERTGAIVDGAMITDRETLASIERGIREYRAGIGNVYTSQEFQARFG
jgi:hypothetical protein